MSLHKQHLNTTLRLTAVTLAATLAGCSLNPFSADDDAASQSAPVAQTTQPARSSAATSNAAPVYTSEPVVQKVNDPVPLADGHPNEYVVQVGDTLWDIAGEFLRDPWYWPEIWYVNPDIVNPHLIYPGDVLGLVYIDGVPRITNVRASTYRMSPQARVTPLTEAIDTIPYEAVSAFLNSGTVLQADQADKLPYMVATRGEHLMAAAGNEIYVRGVDDVVAGTRYSVVHVGDELVDPDDGKVVGYHGLMIGDGTLRRAGDPGTVWLTDSSQEITIGDRLLPETVDVPLNFIPSQPTSQIEGRIMAVVGGVSQIGQYMVVVLNRGTDTGLGVGDVLTVFRAGEVIDDRVAGGEINLPDEEAGTVMVFKSYDRISYALVMEATQAIHVLDAVRNPL
ncbi:MAG: LysM peptidoglycan-binding domain-containing protein [Woeseiaceae bacterium]